MFVCIHKKQSCDWYKITFFSGILTGNNGCDNYYSVRKLILWGVHVNIISSSLGFSLFQSGKKREITLYCSFNNSSLMSLEVVCGYLRKILQFKSIVICLIDHLNLKESIFRIMDNEEE